MTKAYVHYANRDTAGVARVVKGISPLPVTSIGEWPVVRLPSGREVALNPALNEIRDATRAEIGYYEELASEFDDYTSGARSSTRGGVTPAP
jgi:hypothetical protein